MSRRILITGASVAGNTAAWWLTKYGFDVTVVEKAPEFRDGGQNIDVRGAAHEVIRKMALEQAVVDHGTGERGAAWVDEDNKVLAEFDVDDLGAGGPTAELEILRGDLARLIYEPAAKRASYRFGDAIASVEQDAGAASITFQSGLTERFDVVIIAEGVGSPTRDRLFAGENHPRWMNATIGYFTIPRGPTDNDIWRLYNTTGGRGVSVRPDRQGTTRALLLVQKEPEGEHEWSVDQQKAFLRARFTDAGWETVRVLEGMDTAADFYFDVLRQVKMDRYWNGHVVLTGDAAWCATPMSGIGTTLAIVGAYVLAGELSKTEDCGKAFTTYERIMRPFVEEGQGVPKILPRMLNPHSRLGIGLLRGTLRLIGKPGVRDVAAKLFARNSKAIDLPEYKSVAAN